MRQVAKRVAARAAREIRRFLRARSISTHRSGGPARRHGHRDPQASSSRDLADVGVLRVSRPEGASTTEPVNATATPQLAELGETSLLARQRNARGRAHAPGMASRRRPAIDNRACGMLGTLAGDDTIFATPARGVSTRRLRSRSAVSSEGRSTKSPRRNGPGVFAGSTPAPWSASHRRVRLRRDRLPRRVGSRGTMRSSSAKERQAGPSHRDRRREGRSSRPVLLPRLQATPLPGVYPLSAALRPSPDRQAPVAAARKHGATVRWPTRHERAMTSRFDLASEQAWRRS